MTLAAAVPILMDFARDENLHELCKGGNSQGKNNVFFAEQDHTEGREECWNWKKFRCGYDDCRRAHVGPGGLLKDHPENASERQKERRKQKKGKQASDATNSKKPSAGAASFAPDCHFCLDGSDGHQPENCPTVSSTTIDFAYLAGATQEPSTERSDRLKSVGPSRSRSEKIFLPARCRA